MTLHITALYGAIHAVFNVILAANVSRLRAKNNVFLGTGQSAELLVAARRHGNHAEYIALALVLLCIAETNGGSATALHGLAGVLTLGRVAHAFGIGDTPSAPRGFGALLTWVAIAGTGIYGAVLAFSAH